MPDHRYIVHEATVENCDGEVVGQITFLRANQLDSGRYQWKAGHMGTFALDTSMGSGTCSTFDEARAALDAALWKRNSP